MARVLFVFYLLVIATVCVDAGWWCALGAAALGPLGIGAGLAGVGFTGAGIAAGSLAAAAMSTAATTGYGMGVVATLQSVGAAGLGLRKQ